MENQYPDRNDSSTLPQITMISTLKTPVPFWGLVVPSVYTALFSGADKKGLVLCAIHTHSLHFQKEPDTASHRAQCCLTCFFHLRFSLESRSFEKKEMCKHTCILLPVDFPWLHGPCMLFRKFKNWPRRKMIVGCLPNITHNHLFCICHFPAFFGKCFIATQLSKTCATNSFKLW